MKQIKIGLIGGSGLGQAMLARAQGHRHEMDTPFGKPSDAIVEIQSDSLPVLFLSRHGPGHTLNPSQVPYRANIYALKQLGCTHIIASGAVGSLREDLRPRDLVIADQIIDKTTKRPHTFYERAAVHVEFAEPFCPVLRQILMEAGKELMETSATAPSTAEQTAAQTSAAPSSNSASFRIHERGCYVCMEGPAFSSRAESLMHRLWGADLVGMTAMPEAKLAREAEMSYALVALVTDYDCWRTPSTPDKKDSTGVPADPSVLLKEIIANLEAATNNGIALIERALRIMAGRQEELQSAPAQQSLRLAIWSDKTKIDRQEVARLSPLWGRYITESAAT